MLGRGAVVDAAAGRLVLQALCFFLLLQLLQERQVVVVVLGRRRGRVLAIPWRAVEDGWQAGLRQRVRDLLTLRSFTREIYSENRQRQLHSGTQSGATARNRRAAVE